MMASSGAPVSDAAEGVPDLTVPSDSDIATGAAFDDGEIDAPTESSPFIDRSRTRAGPEAPERAKPPRVRVGETGLVISDEARTRGRLLFDAAARGELIPLPMGPSTESGATMRSFQDTPGGAALFAPAANLRARIDVAAPVTKAWNSVVDAAAITALVDAKAGMLSGLDALGAWGARNGLTPVVVAGGLVYAGVYAAMPTSALELLPVGRAGRIGTASDRLALDTAEQAAIRERVRANVAESARASGTSNFGKLNEWPSDNGFVPGAYERYTLWPGQTVDRYGSAQGSYAAQYGTSYRARGLKPGSDSLPYKVYEVTQPITVTAGPAKAWFGYEGGGMQYKFDESIRNLLARGVLRAKN